MNFNNKEHLELYLKRLKELGFGSQGVVYQDKKNNKAIKIYDLFLDGDEEEYMYDKNEILRFNNIVNDTYVFPEDVVSINNKVVGYISKYVQGKSLYKINPLLIKLDDFTNSINSVIKDTDKLTRESIATYDVMYNIMYSNKKFYIIDTDEYSYTFKDLKRLSKDNNSNFDTSIKYFLVDCLFDEFVESYKLLYEMYKDDYCDSITFLKEFKKLLSEYNGKEINKLHEVKNCTNKEKRIQKFIRYV